MNAASQTQVKQVKHKEPAHEAFTVALLVILRLFLGTGSTWWRLEKHYGFCLKRAQSRGTGLWLNTAKIFVSPLRGFYGPDMRGSNSSWLCNFVMPYHRNCWICLLPVATNPNQCHKLRKFSHSLTSKIMLWTLSMPQQTVVIFNLLWVHGGVFDQCLVVDFEKSFDLR